ncbi:MAG: guanylate kinase [Acidobacteriota bacterium]
MPGGRRGADAIPRRTARSARGGVFVVSAPSGTGKTTLCRRLVDELQGIDFSVSYTTRARRQGERDGVDYRFIDREEFERRRRMGEFVEWASVGGQLYGTAAAAIREATARGRDIVLDIDTQGADSIRRLISDAVLVFIMPPGKEALRERLLGRGTENEAALGDRLRLARGEIDKSGRYDYIVVNDDLEVAYDHLRAIVLAERCRRQRQMTRLREIAADFAAGR